MRFLKGLFIFLFVTVIFILLGLILFVKTFDVNKYKPQITQELSKAIGRQVTMGNIALNLSADQKITLRIEDLIIADDPQFSQENFLEVQQINLGLDAGYFIAQRQILVSSIELLSASITLIRNKEGRFNVLSLAAPHTSAAPLVDNFQKTAGPTAGPPLPAASQADQGEDNGKQFVPALQVKSLELKEGRVRYIDQSFGRPLVIETAPLSVRVDDFSLDRPFTFFLETALWAQKENMHLNGSIQLNMKDKEIDLTDMILESELSRLSVDSLKQSLAALDALKLIKSLKGGVTIEIKQAKINPQGLVDLTLEGKLTDSKVEIEGLATALEAQGVTVFMTERTLEIPETTLTLGSGEIVISGKIDDYLKEQKFEFRKVVEDLELAEVISQDQQANQLYGKVFGEYNVRGSGFKYPDVLTSLNGGGRIEIKDGRLTNINILKVVLDKISMLPGLVEKLETNLPEQYKEKLKAKDTALPKVVLTSSLRDGVYRLDNMEVHSDVFSMTGEGQLTLDYQLSLNTAIYIPQDLSERMAASIEGLKYLLDESGRIFIPITVQGKVPQLTFFPDLEYLGKKILVNRGASELEKVIHKALGIEESFEPPPDQWPPGQEGQPQTASPEGEKPQSPERQLIDQILDGIFK